MEYNIKVDVEASFLHHATPRSLIVISLLAVHQLSCERGKDIIKSLSEGADIISLSVLPGASCCLVFFSIGQQ